MTGAGLTLTIVIGIAALYAIALIPALNIAFGIFCLAAVLWFL